MVVGKTTQKDYKVSPLGKRKNKNNMSDFEPFPTVKGSWINCVLVLRVSEQHKTQVL